MLRQLGKDVDALASITKAHWGRGSVTLGEAAASFPALGHALGQQRRVQLVRDDRLQCCSCGRFLPALHLAPHTCRPLEFDVAVMRRQGMAATRRAVREDRLQRRLDRARAAEAAAAAWQPQTDLQRQVRREQLEQARAELARVQEEAARGLQPAPDDGATVCRLCNQQLGPSAHACRAYYCTTTLVEATDLPNFGVDLGAPGQEKAARLLQMDVPILTVMRAVGEDQLVTSLTYTAAAGSMGRGLYAAAKLPRGAWVVPYSGRRLTPEEAMAFEGGRAGAVVCRCCMCVLRLNVCRCRMRADHDLAISQTSAHDNPRDPAAEYVHPARLGAVGRMPNQRCVGANMTLVRGLVDRQRGYQVARLRATQTVWPGEQLTWRYGASTHCRAEAAAVLCQCAACDQKAAEGRPREPLYALADGSVERCGACQTCLLAAFTAPGS